MAEHSRTLPRPRSARHVLVVFAGPPGSFPKFRLICHTSRTLTDGCNKAFGWPSLRCVSPARPSTCPQRLKVNSTDSRRLSSVKFLPSGSVEDLCLDDR